jgi:hypothetical protein
MTPEDLRDYWDAFVSGSPVPEPIDPDLAATIRAIHAQDDAPRSDPSLMAGVWRDLLGEPFPAAPFETLRVEAPVPNGHPAPGTTGHGTTVLATAPSRRHRLLDTVMRAVRLLAIGVMAGFGAGFAGGIGARLAMRVSGLLTDPRNRGLLTENGNVVGEITFAGTFFLAVFAGLLGVLGGLLYVAIRSRLPGTGWRRGLIYGGLLLATFGFVVMDKNNPDYHLFGPPGVNVGTFSLLYVLFGLVVAPLADWLDRSLPAWPPVRPLGRRALAGYVLLAPLGLIGLVVVVGGTIGGGGLTGLLFGVLIAVPVVSSLGPRLFRFTQMPRPALVGYALLAAPSLIGLVLTMRAIAGILGAG